jgi:hypothetical protein
VGSSGLVTNSRSQSKRFVEMSDREVERLRGFLAEGGGQLSHRAREKEFRALTDEGTTRVEALYSELFGDFGREAV